MHIREANKIDSKLQVSIAIEHNTNFQDMNERYARRNKSIMVLEQALKEEGVKYEQYYQFDD